METFLEFVITRLVEAPEEVLVTKVEQGRKLIFKVEMRKSDVGKVIGRNGHTITAVRNLLNAAFLDDNVGQNAVIAHEIPGSSIVGYRAKAVFFRE